MSKKVYTKESWKDFWQAVGILVLVWGALFLILQIGILICKNFI